MRIRIACYPNSLLDEMFMHDRQHMHKLQTRNEIIKYFVKKLINTKNNYKDQNTLTACNGNIGSGSGGDGSGSGCLMQWSG